MNADALFAIMKTRRSVRKYTDRPVPEAILQRLLKAAQWGPSAHNRQPWRWAVLTTADRRASLAAAMGARFRADLEADGLPLDKVERMVVRSYQRISTAPAVIVLFLSMADMDRYPDPGRQEAERVMAIQSVALAAQNLLLLAHAEGLGVCWMCAPLFCPDVVRAELDLPDDWEAQGLLTVGYPAEERVSERAVLEAKLRWY
ncbi:MAG: nitroreductase family protein [Chloroflexi bacterium]|nr:nitroreductase family protein [Chloroflexota bacterium]